MALLNFLLIFLGLPPLFFPICAAECAENEENRPGMGGGAEMSNEQSMELHPYSPGPAPLLVPEEGENDLLRAVAPFLRGEAIPVQDQRPQPGPSEAEGRGSAQRDLIQELLNDPTLEKSYRNALIKKEEIA